MNLMSSSSRLRLIPSPGFTLTELAIVLGIIGVIMGAVWTAASNVYAEKKTNQATTDVLFIVQGVQALYATAQTTGDKDGTNETTNLSQAGIFPTDMDLNGIGSAWGYPPKSSTMVTSQSQTSSPKDTGDAFEIEITGVPSGGCFSILSAIAGTSRAPGLFYANAGTTQGATKISLPTLTLPVTSTAAEQACLGGTTGVSVQFAFNLHG